MEFDVLRSLGVLSFVVLVLAGCKPHESWRQKLALFVDTPQGEVSGSSVISVAFSGKNRIILRDLDSARLSLTGEAAMVEVLPGRWLFALLPDQEKLIYNYAKEHLADGPIGLEEAVPIIVNHRASVPLDPAPDPNPHAGRKFPMLVTFEDTARPETVRLVDPFDLDATFGCPRTDGVLFPWRSVGLTWRDWIESETTRLSREMAAVRAGLNDPVAAAALEENALMADDRHTDRKEKLRHEELRKLFTNDQQRLWNVARLELIKEIPATLPSPETLSASAGGQCYVLKAATVQVTDEPVTEGRVEGVLPWLEEVGRERSTLIPHPPPLSMDMTNPDIQLLDSSAFSTELFK